MSSFNSFIAAKFAFVNSSCSAFRSSLSLSLLHLTCRFMGSMQWSLKLKEWFNCLGRRTSNFVSNSSPTKFRPQEIWSIKRDQWARNLQSLSWQNSMMLLKNGRSLFFIELYHYWTEGVINLSLLDKRRNKEPPPVMGSYIILKKESSTVNETNKLHNRC